LPARQGSGARSARRGPAGRPKQPPAHGGSARQPSPPPAQQNTARPTAQQNPARPPAHQLTDLQPGPPPAHQSPGRKPTRARAHRSRGHKAARAEAHRGSARQPGRRPNRSPGRRPAHRPPTRGIGLQGRRRAFAVLLLLGGAFAAITIKLLVIQGVDSASYLAAGGSEWEQSVTLPAERGSILDRNGDELAMSLPQTTIYADPHQVADPFGESEALAPILKMKAQVLQSLMTEERGFVYLARTVDDATAARVAALNLAGIYSLKEPKPFYPAGQLALPILGSVGTDGTGLGGLEYKYNAILAGRSGRSVDQIDPSGHPIPGGGQGYRAPEAGDDLVLSLDEPLQYETEQALAQAIVAARAKAGIALLMNSKTGQILADAQLTMPSRGNTLPPAVPVNVATAAASTPASSAQPVEAPSATAFTRVYEPGSVNKLITISAALQAGVIKPTDVFTIPDSYQVAGTTFHDAESHPVEHWNVTDILTNSSNIGTIQIAGRLGKDNLLHYIKQYGLGSVTDVGMPGESAGLLPPYWSGTSIADVPIGQGIAVTAIQMIAAYNTIANGGVYVPPRLVDATIDAAGHAHPIPAAPTHRVVSTQVARQMTTMLDEVVQVGTGRAANLDPYTVAGKTGTALVPVKGGYEGGHYVASFAGFVPAEDPQITGMVVIDDTPDYGAAASAPTFATIARDALHEFNIPPMPKQPPAPGVPLATSQNATAAGDVAGTPLPGLVNPPTAEPTQPATLTKPTTPRPANQASGRTPDGTTPAEPTGTTISRGTAGRVEAAQQEGPPGTVPVRTQSIPLRG
jgi:cell division protein FtsI (penicillin-binding protein 3)